MSAVHRVAIAGVHIESSTFSPHRSTARDFTVRRAAELYPRYGWLGPSGEPVVDWACDIEWVPILHARALPGGVVSTEAYASWRAEILAGLQAGGPWDGVLLDIHGAMSVVGMDDVEGELAEAVRAAVGPDAVLSTSMDLHGNVSKRLFDACDILTCYRTAPHIDVVETRERAAANLAAALRDGTTLHRALVRVPILLPGEKTSTRMEPAASLYARLPGIVARDGIVDAAIWIGYAWADQPRCSGAVVVTGTQARAVEDAATELGRAFWDAREEFAFVAPTGSMEECLAAALASSSRPFFLSDSGDNPGAGGADDTTYALARLLAAEPVVAGRVRAVFASIADPEAVDAVWGRAVGERVALTVGGRVDTTPPGPVAIDGVIAALVEDPEGGRTAVLRVGGLEVIVTEKRTQYATLDRFRLLGIDVAARDIVVVKIGYLEPELYDAAADWLLALTPGGVDQDLARLPYRHVVRPLFPLDPEATADLTALVR